ncbi:hypothetical protein M0805_005187 [Coniferiporia weirii]|nr:hypothetical protein M0805_005187 [Coniferiporia weirii]
MARYSLSRLMGDGILVTEGEKHRWQNPSFSPSSVKGFTPIFFQKSLQLRDVWKSWFTEELESQRIEVLSWLSRTTLDITICFDYEFNALNVDQEPNEVNKDFSTLVDTTGAFNTIQILQAIFPVFRIIPTKRKREERPLWQRYDALDVNSNSDMASGDLLSALVRANMDTELPDAQRLADKDVLAQISTFLVAGHKTTSTQTMWCLFALAQQPATQARLRSELLAVPSDTPSADTLGVLPFLDAVVRETLRLHAAVPSTIRVAMRDDVIPLAEPFVDTKGQRRTEIRITKDTGIFIPILALNRTKAIWGADAAEFNPDRWANLPEASKDIPGVWGNMLTFLGGARSCIGYRFALFEMKALLFTLLRTFEFELALPVADIERRSFVVTRPYIKGQKDAGPQMPLIVKLHRGDA